jgi:hypothetical protein
VTVMVFGEVWDARITEGAAVLPEVPTYARCLRCREYIAEGDSGFVRPHVGRSLDPDYLVGVGGPDARAANQQAAGFALTAIHRECDLIGVLGHVVKVCTCTGYDTTSREAALEAWRRFESGEWVR